jgi:CheY-like chemotaxis protein
VPSTYRVKTALLVDDNEIDNFINERIIQTSGFAEQVIIKNSTDSALEFLRSGPGEADFPEVIFLDLNMPGKDGFVFLQEFDTLPAGVKEKTRVVVLSSSISPDDISKASTNPYVLKYINKPLSEKYLEAIRI